MTPRLENLPSSQAIAVAGDGAGASNLEARHVQATQPGACKIVPGAEPAKLEVLRLSAGGVPASPRIDASPQSNGEGARTQETPATHRRRSSDTRRRELQDLRQHVPEDARDAFKAFAAAWRGPGSRSESVDERRRVGIAWTNLVNACISAWSGIPGDHRTGRSALDAFWKAQQASSSKSGVALDMERLHRHVPVVAEAEFNAFSARWREMRGTPIAKVTVEQRRELGIAWLSLVNACLTSGQPASGSPRSALDEFWKEARESEAARGRLAQHGRAAASSRVKRAEQARGAGPLGKPFAPASTSSLQVPKPPGANRVSAHESRVWALEKSFAAMVDAGEKQGTIGMKEQRELELLWREIDGVRALAEYRESHPELQHLSEGNFKTQAFRAESALAAVAEKLAPGQIGRRGAAVQRALFHDRGPGGVADDEKARKEANLALMKSFNFD